MKKSLSIIASLILSVFFVGILLFVVLTIFCITDYDIVLPALVFSSINFAAIIAFLGFGKPISNTIGVGFYAPISLVTILYTIANFVFLGFVYKTASSSLFTLVSLVILFIYLLIVIPLLVFGMNNKENKN